MIDIALVYDIVRLTLIICTIPLVAIIWFVWAIQTDGWVVWFMEWGSWVAINKKYKRRGVEIPLWGKRNE